MNRNKQKNLKQNLKKCCYMNRACSPDCVAYSVSRDLIEGTKIMGMDDMHCIRLLLEITRLMNTTTFEDIKDENIKE